ncbi:MAG: hypothetical protein HYV65_00565 [Candidatus Spechtbacteria bacterium]|nr:hypothetical protein [Candidatus Spechtbacteria bacterium]
MQKIIKKSLVYIASLFIVLTFLAPLAYAANPIVQANECVVRSEISAVDVNTLVGGGGALIAPGTVLPSGIAAGNVVNDAIRSGFGVLCTFALVQQIFNILFLVVGTLSVVIILYAAFLFLTAGQTPTNLVTAKNLLLYAVVGIILAVVARLLPSLIIGFLGTK